MTATERLQILLRHVYRHDRKYLLAPATVEGQVRAIFAHPEIVLDALEENLELCDSPAKVLEILQRIRGQLAEQSG